MVTLHPKFVVDEQQRPQAVLLPVEEWERVIAELEDLDDLRAFDSAKSGPRDAIPFEQAVHENQDKYGKRRILLRFCVPHRSNSPR